MNVDLIAVITLNPDHSYITHVLLFSIAFIEHYLYTYPITSSVSPPVILNHFPHYATSCEGFVMPYNQIVDDV